MSTFTPTSDQISYPNVTTFQTGDTVKSKTDGRIGKVVKSDGLVPIVLTVDKQGNPIPPTIVMVPNPVATLPTAYSAGPTNTNTNVQWNDGTNSVVPLSTLERWS